MIEAGIRNINPYRDEDVYDCAISGLSAMLEELDLSTASKITIDCVPIKIGHAGRDRYWFVIDGERRNCRCADLEELADAVLMTLRGYLIGKKPLD
jgi:hypothetical protein